MSSILLQQSVTPGSMKVSFFRQLFSIGDMLKIAVDNNALSVNGKPKIGTLEVDKWINLVIRVRIQAWHVCKVLVL